MTYLYLDQIHILWKEHCIIHVQFYRILYLQTWRQLQNVDIFNK